MQNPTSTSEKSKKIKSKNNYLIGVISDTHGRLPQSVAQAFKGVDLIIHAGDIGELEIIEALEEFAPTLAVRGNMDFGQWAHKLSAQEIIEFNQTLLVVLHDVDRLKLNSSAVTPNSAVRFCEYSIFYPTASGPNRGLMILRIRGNNLRRDIEFPISRWHRSR